MNCQSCTERLDDFTDGRLSAEASNRFAGHVKSCSDCAARVDEARRLKKSLRSLGKRDPAMPDEQFYRQAMARAAAAGSKKIRRRYWVRGFGSAIAAGLALFAVTLLMLESPGSIDSPGIEGIPKVSMTLEETRTVNLVFASANDLVDATLTVVLPEGIEIAGFGGQREISWQTSLREGRNVLPLKLIASSPVGGELLATLEHENDGRTFRLRVDVTDGPV